jgi:hypothetical protein
LIAENSEMYEEIKQKVLVARGVADATAKSVETKTAVKAEPKDDSK